MRRLEVNLRPMHELEAKADELRDAEQQFQIGRRYHNGLNCPQDLARAIEWYERAVHAGHAGAANNLGVIYDNGALPLPSPQDRFQCKFLSCISPRFTLRHLLHLISSHPFFCAFFCVHTGPAGVDKSYERAFHYFSIGGERGSNVAMKNLGIMHEDGRPGVVPKDKVISIDWYGRAAAAGNEYAKERLAVLLNRHEAPLLLKALAGDADAMFECAKKCVFCRAGGVLRIQTECGRVSERNIPAINLFSLNY